MRKRSPGWFIGFWLVTIYIKVWRSQDSFVEKVNVEFKVPMIWTSRWLLGGDTGWSYLAGRVVVDVNWVDGCKGQGLAHIKCSTNGNPYSYWELTYIWWMQPRLLMWSQGKWWDERRRLRAWGTPALERRVGKTLPRAWYRISPKQELKR